jgi:uncharacterized integral membrane protein
MSQQKNKSKDRQIGKKVVTKKPLIDPRYKNTVVSLLVVVVLLIFFIINNTRAVPEHGPYPPNYHGSHPLRTQ